MELQDLVKERSPVKQGTVRKRMGTAPKHTDSSGLRRGPWSNALLPNVLAPGQAQKVSHLLRPVDGDLFTSHEVFRSQQTQQNPAPSRHTHFVTCDPLPCLPGLPTG